MCKRKSFIFPCFKQMKVCFSGWNKWRFLDHVGTSWTNLLPNVALWLWSFSPLASKNDLTKTVSERNRQLLLMQWQDLDCALILSGLITLNCFNDFCPLKKITRFLSPSISQKRQYFLLFSPLVIKSTESNSLWDTTWFKSR